MAVVHERWLQRDRDRDRRGIAVTSANDARAPPFCWTIDT